MFYCSFWKAKYTPNRRRRKPTKNHLNEKESVLSSLVSSVSSCKSLAEIVNKVARYQQRIEEINLRMLEREYIIEVGLIGVAEMNEDKAQ